MAKEKYARIGCDKQEDGFGLYTSTDNENMCLEEENLDEWCIHNCDCCPYFEIVDCVCLLYDCDNEVIKQFIKEGQNGFCYLIPEGYSIPENEWINIGNLKAHKL